LVYGTQKMRLPASEAKELAVLILQHVPAESVE